MSYLGRHRVVNGVLVVKGQKKDAHERPKGSRLNHYYVIAVCHVSMATFLCHK